LIGNPQNMLIGEVLDLSFPRYLRDAGVPALVGLLVVWLLIVRGYRGHWTRTLSVGEVTANPFKRWQTAKGLVVVGAVMAAFLFTNWPREIVALTAAGVLLASREMASREMLGLVDWHLLVLFAGLFIVNAAVGQAGLLSEAFLGIRAAGIDLADPPTLFGVTAILSNLVSNVPAVMMLLPVTAHPLAGPILALSSTLAGNLFIVGSIANIIVVDQARRLGVEIDWRTHARVGIPVTLVTLALAGAWLWLIS
jgi:Na+/H+ antiporter NhaD/arsenite permease-like protein